MALDPREKAERITALFRDRRQIDILPPELMPADLDEAYRVRTARSPFEAQAIQLWDAPVRRG